MPPVAAALHDHRDPDHPPPVADADAVLWCHGGPGCRLDPAYLAEAATAARLRLVGIDRPGYGRSDPEPGRTIAGWVPDALAVADHLGIDRFLIVGLSTGVKLERDRFAGLDFRSMLDAGLSWALVHHPEWTLDGISSIAWLHESRTDGIDVNDPIGILQLLSRIPFGTAGDTTQRFTYYPNFSTASAYRSEAEITAQAAMSAHLALKIGYLLRYSNDPVPGFKTTDNTTTASVVLRWKATTPAR